jgi:hypothetical protein
MVPPRPQVTRAVQGNGTYGNGPFWLLLSGGVKKVPGPWNRFGDRLLELRAGLGEIWIRDGG